MQLELEERLQSEKREAASRRIEELQSVVGSHARVSIAIGPTKDMLVEQARRLQARFGGNLPALSGSGRRATPTVICGARQVSTPRALAIGQKEPPG